MAIEVHTVRQLKGASPRTKLHHLHKTVCRRGINVHLTNDDIHVTPAVMSILLQRRPEDLDKGDSQALRTLLGLRHDREASPCLAPASETFKAQSRDMEAAAGLFYLLVGGPAAEAQ
ncbi:MULTISPECIES: hypothetical protein [unclassified Halomonas]|uniref:hypothetical protein n=1 Tax=unclassified Halomonas TaxID=2609666 RepID=UPI0005FA9038|nr:MULTISPECIES: hypothetical protein [unclassified Halomonas]KJZ17155.1 hypothetical protein TW86_04750 [Halomonas sp. S2151]MCO7215017.1 hypothetical protein [Halomonas sp. OfavH-34-E]RQW70077.1 hypothetical protein EBB56_15625 [Halomonas sp. YLB-10]